MLSNNLIFLSVTIGLIFFAKITFSNKISLLANKNVSYVWFQGMDCIKDGSRYQGERSKIVIEDSYEKHSIGCYTFYYYCETKSGRTFYIKITSNMGLVTNWDLIPVDRSEIYG